MKVEPLSAKDIYFVERPQAPIRNKARQIEIIRSYLMRATQAEILDMQLKVERPDFQPEVRRLFYSLHRTYGGDRNPQSSSPSPIPISEPEISEGF